MTELMCDTKFRILRNIYRNSDVTSMQVADALSLKRRTVTNWLKVMREEQLIKRRKRLEDTKTWFSSLTEEGRSVYITESCKRGVLGMNEL